MAEDAYLLGPNFPHEAFVKAAVLRHFAPCQEIPDRRVDFICLDQTGRRWVIEAKGKTGSTGLDFRTGLGQLLQAMAERETSYGIAVPATAQFDQQRAQIPEWVRSALGWYWLLVDQQGEVTVVPPEST